MIDGVRLQRERDDAAVGELVAHGEDGTGARVAPPFGIEALFWGRGGDGVLHLGKTAAAVAARAGIAFSFATRSARSHLAGAPPCRTSHFEGIARVPPGFRLASDDDRVQRAWTLPRPRPNAPRDPEQAVGRLLEAALLPHLQSGAVDLLLSGGLDSSLLAALAARAGAKVRAFTLDLPGAGADLRRARALARRIGAEHVVLAVDGHDLADHLEPAVRAVEAPILHPLAVAKYLLHREAARSGARSVVSGIGADEVFLGNPRRVPYGARRRELTSTLPSWTVPAECHTARPHDISVTAPYLEASVVALGLGLPRPSLARGGTGKLVLRRLAAELLPGSVAWAPKEPRLFDVPRRGRRRWEETIADLVSPASIARLDLGTSADSHLRRARTDRSFRMRLASLAILARIVTAAS